MRKFWKHQRDAIERAKTSPDLGLFFDPGLGKTATTVQILKDLNAKYGGISALILAPVVVVPGWGLEISEHAREFEQNCYILSGPIQRRIKEIQKARRKHGGNFIAITNYEAFSVSEAFHKEILSWRPSVLILDESQMCKNISSKRTKRIIRVSDEANHHYILSGTPFPNAEDIYAQFRILDKGESFGRNFYGFRNRYFTDYNARMPRQNYFPNWQLKKGVEQELKEKIQTKAVMAKKDECLDLPPLVRKDIIFELDPKQRRHYEELKKVFITMVDDSACTADTAVVLIIRLLQVSSGFLKTVDNVTPLSIGSARDLALKELLSQFVGTEHKIIIWAVFKANYLQIKNVCKALGIGYTECHGEISSKKKEENLQQFKNNAKTQVLIANASSVGKGANLQEAAYAIYFTKNFSWENYEQSKARNYRAGSEVHKNVTHYHLIAKNTVEEHIEEILEKRTQFSNEMLQEIKELL